MRREQPGGRRLGGEVGVEPQHQIGLGRRPFELEAVQHRHRVTRRHPGDGAVAGFLEGLFHLGSGAPVGHEAVIGVNRQRVLGGGGGRGQSQR